VSQKYASWMIPWAPVFHTVADSTRLVPQAQKRHCSGPHSDQNHTAFLTCEPITYLSFTPSALCQPVLCFSSIEFMMVSSGKTLLINKVVFDILQIPSEGNQICNWCYASTCLRAYSKHSVTSIMSVCVC
jgi:hypothetical protein